MTSRLSKSDKIPLTAVLRIDAPEIATRLYMKRRKRSPKNTTRRGSVWEAPHLDRPSFVRQVTVNIKKTKHMVLF